LAITSPPVPERIIVRAEYTEANRSGGIIHGSTGQRGPMVTLPVRISVPLPPRLGDSGTQDHSDPDGNGDEDDDEERTIKSGFGHTGLIALPGKRIVPEIVVKHQVRKEKKRELWLVILYPYLEITLGMVADWTFHRCFPAVMDISTVPAVPLG